MEDGKTWLTADYSIECWTEEHSNYALAYALPCILVWGVGIPMVSMILIYKSRNKLDKEETMLKF